MQCWEFILRSVLEFCFILVDQNKLSQNDCLFPVILKSTFDEYNGSETFVATRIGELLDDFTKINIQSNFSDLTSSYNTIGEFSNNLIC